jgi:predicted RNA-binding protein (virulence factor B family)
MKLDKFVSKQPENLNFGEKVEVIVWKEHPLGLQVLIDEEYLGMLYKNQIYKALFPGDKTSAYVNQIRDDGRVDLLLQAPGYEVVDEATKTVLLKLQQAENGVLPYSDKTASDIIQREFNMSKKTFKKVIGGLYRRNLIDLKPTMILLTEAGRQANL